MQKMNVAYDLSIYENQLETQNKPQEKTAKTIKIKTSHNYVIKRITAVLTLAVFLSLIIGVIYTNASITTAANNITNAQKAITELESEKAYLQFTLESKMSLKNIEDYAIGTLGLVKMNAAQIEYVEIEEENKIEKNGENLTEKIEDTVQPILSYFTP